MGFTFPVAADPKRKVYSLFAVESIPRTYLIGRDGKVAYTRSGFFEEDVPQLQEAVSRLLRAP
jgi:hypothetical protein